MYSEAERAIFGPYHDGAGHRYADPVRAQRRLTQALDGEPNQWLAKMKSPLSQEAATAVDRVVAAVVSAFELNPFDPTTGLGMTDDQVLQLASNFFQWKQSKKATAEPSPTLPPSTGSAENSPSATGTAST